MSPANQQVLASAKLLHSQGLSQQAYSMLQRVLEEDAPTGELLELYGDCCRQIGYVIEAADAYRLASELSPNLVRPKIALAQLLKDQGLIDQAISLFSSAIDLDPTAIDAFLGAAAAFEDMGRFELAASTVQHILRKDPTNTFALYRLCHLTRNGNYLLTEADTERLKTLEKDASILGDRRRFLLFALGYQHEANCDFESAFACFAAAHEARRRQLRIQGLSLTPPQINQEVDRQIATFDSALFDWATEQGVGNPSERLVFVVGLPHSGTSIVTRLLTELPSVAVAGRLPDLDFLAWRGMSRSERKKSEEAEQFPNWIATRDAEYLNGLAGLYLQKIDSLSSDARYVVNELGDQSHLIGLIALLFPNAIVIHCRRDVRSIGCEWLTACEASDRSASIGSNQENIAAYSKATDRLMAHWKAVTSLSILEVDFEDLEMGIDDSLKQLAAFLKIECNDSAPEIAKAAVNSMSIRTWQDYEPQLKPLLENLHCEESVCCGN